MEAMIHDYENSRALLVRRIHELNTKLRNKSLMHHEREQLLIRKEMLTAETIELLHSIEDMKSHNPPIKVLRTAPPEIADIA